MAKAAKQEAEVTAPAEGMKAPVFANVPGDNGKTYSLKDFAGRKLVLYFYPKDDTPGCTLEGREFSAKRAEFEKAGAVAVGVSRDSIKDHCKFRDKYGLSVLLLSDEDGSLCEAYGVWKLKKFMGKEYMGIERSTFLIDGQGVVRRAWSKVSVEGHVEEVLAALKGL